MSPATFNHLQNLLYELVAVNSVLCGNPFNAREFDDIVFEIQEIDQKFDLDSFLEKLI